jgi:hypothetical protein
MPLLQNRVIAGIVAAILCVFGIWGLSQVFENVEADDIVIIQAPFSGELSFYTSPGTVWQNFGSVTIYKRRSMYEFDCTETKVEKVLTNDRGQQYNKETSVWTGGKDIRFNDGGHGMVCGSLQYEMSLDAEQLRKLYQRFKNPDQVRNQLLMKMTDSAIYLAGQLMSSKESYNETRNDLIHFISDQIQNGVYRTRTKTVLVTDQITQQQKYTSVAEIILDKDGKPERQEVSALHDFGLKIFNFTISRLPYDDQVEAQIQQQQKLAMDVQTSVAELKKAEQRALTVVKEGEANAAGAKWEQEVQKAKAVVLAQQEQAVQELNAKRDQNVAVTLAERDRQVADLKKQAAEFTKKEQILLGEGEAQRRTLVMNADGALTIKVDAYKHFVDKFSDAIARYPGNWVPQIVMGGRPDDSTAGSGALTMMDVLNVQALKSLGLDIGVKTSPVTQPDTQR